MDDFLTFGAIGMAAVGLVLWIATNWHLRWAKNELQKYGTEARQQTEAFVSREIETLAATFRAETASIREAIPPLTDDGSALRAELQEFSRQVGEDMGWMKTQWASVMNDRKIAGQELAKIATEQADKMRAELGAASQALPPEVQGDVRAHLLKILTREPTARERKEMGWMGELASAAMKKGLYDWLSGGQLSSGNGRYRITVPAGNTEF